MSTIMKRVLIVSDDAVAREILCYLLWKLERQNGFAFDQCDCAQL